MLRGDPLTEELRIPWSEVTALRIGSLRIGRWIAPTLEVRREVGDPIVLRVLHDHGSMATFTYAERLLTELNTIRPPRAADRISARRW